MTPDLASDSFDDCYANVNFRITACKRPILTSCIAPG